LFRVVDTVFFFFFVFTRPLPERMRSRMANICAIIDPGGGPLFFGFAAPGLGGSFVFVFFNFFFLNP
jgi:hypothetical protein